MHSSRMCTIRSSDRISEGWWGCWGLGVVSASQGGCPLWGGVCSRDRGSDSRGDVCSGGCLLLGVVCSGGVCSGRCVSALGVSARGGGIPACTEADTPIPRGQTDACKNITFATSLRTVIRKCVLSLDYAILTVRITEAFVCLN